MNIESTPEFSGIRGMVDLVLAMRKVGLRDRDVIIRALRNVMESHEQYLGLWCVFEPNAFDGRDSVFVGSEGHDSSGRFAPRWNRNGGTLRFGCSQGHDLPALGEWYRIAKDSRQEVVFGPYDEQPLTGLPVLCLSRVIPILERGQFIGAVGVDVSLDAMVEVQADANHPLEGMLGRSHVFLGDDLSIRAMSLRSRLLLDRYAGPCRGKVLPSPIKTALHAPETPRRLLKLAKGAGGLHIHVVKHPHSGQLILSLEETVRRGTIAPEGAAISAREQEVLEWLCGGKSNPEIALILGISEHTVRHHLERIFSKLGVENRHAAMRLVQSTSRDSEPRFLSRTPALAN